MVGIWNVTAGSFTTVQCRGNATTTVPGEGKPLEIEKDTVALVVTPAVNGLLMSKTGTARMPGTIRSIATRLGPFTITSLGVRSVTLARDSTEVVDVGGVVTLASKNTKLEFGTNMEPMTISSCLEELFQVPLPCTPDGAWNLIAGDGVLKAHPSGNINEMTPPAGKWPSVLWVENVIVTFVDTAGVFADNVAVKAPSRGLLMGSVETFVGPSIRPPAPVLVVTTTADFGFAVDGLVALCTTRTSSDDARTLSPPTVTTRAPELLFQVAGFETAPIWGRKNVTVGVAVLNCQPSATGRANVIDPPIGIAPVVTNDTVTGL